MNVGGEGARADGRSTVGGAWPMKSDAHRFGRNFGSTALSQLIAQVLTLAASVVLFRKLGVAGYGMYVFGFAFPSWFLLLMTLGLDEAIATQVAADRSKASRYLTLVALFRVFLAVVAFVGLWGATQLVLDDPFARTVTLILGASTVVTSYAGTFTAIFRAFERLEYAALVTVVERSITIGVVLLALWFGYGLLEVSLVFLGGSLIALALSIIVARRRFVWFTRNVDFRELRQILRIAMPFGLFNAVGTFTYTAGVVLLTLLQSEESTGLFNAAFTLLLAMFSFLSIVSLAALPMMSRMGSESREKLSSALHRIQRLSFVFGVPLAFGGWFYADAILTTFYGAAVEASANIFRVLVLSFAVETAAMGIGPALAATGHAVQKLYIGTAGAAVTIALCIVLIPSLGPMGVAYAFLVSRILTASLGGLAVRHYVAPLGAWDAMVKSTLSASLMFLVLFAIPGLSLWTGVLLGAGVYFGALWGIRGMSREDRLVVWNALRGALFR